MDFKHAFDKMCLKQYTRPGNAHKLNLVIANASKLMQIKNCVGVVNETYLFLKVSPKRQ